MPTLKIVCSTVDPTSIADIVAQEFGLSGIESCIFIRRGSSDTYELRLADGQRRIARLSHRRPRGEPNLAYELSLLQHLRVHGVAVAAPHRTKYGALSAAVDTPEGPRRLALFDHLEGAPPGENHEAIELMGAGLAKIHVTARRYTGPGSLYKLDIDYLVREPLARIEALAHLPRELKSRFSGIAADLEARIEENSLTLVHCHGDCHGTNTFVGKAKGGAQIAKFFDFDDSGPGYLAYDLAVFLSTKMLINQQRKPTAETMAAWKAFVGGYRSVAEIPDDDFAAIAPFASARLIWLAGEYAGNVHWVGIEFMPNAWYANLTALLEAWRDLTTPRG